MDNAQQVRARHDALVDVGILDQLCEDFAQEFERLVESETQDAEPPARSVVRAPTSVWGRVLGRLRKGA